MGFPADKLLSLLCIFACFSSFSVEGLMLNGGTARYIVRKCCAAGEYYNLQHQQCMKEGNLKAFEAMVQNRLMKGSIKEMVVVTGRLLRCPDTNECFETVEIISDKSHTILPDGLIFDNLLRLTYDLRNYCVESTGLNNQNVSLAIAFCLPQTNILPKCCPPNHYFHTRTFECIPYPQNDDSETSLLTFLYFKNEVFLRYERDLACSSAFPIKLNLLSEAYIDECNNICLRSPRKCYSMGKFCLDNALTHRLEPSVYVCADNHTKVCCKNEFFEDNEIMCSCGPMIMH